MLLPDIINFLGLEPISLVQTTLNSLAQHETAGLLASPTTIQSDLYRHMDGPSIVYLSETEQRKTEAIIRNIIAGKNPVQLSKELQRQARLFKSQGIKKVVLGCTELSLIAHQAKLHGFIDPVELTINDII